MSGAYNVPLALRLRGKVDEAALTRAVEEIQRRHEALRTRFERQSRGAVQVIDPPGLALEVEVVSAAEANTICRAERCYPFDLWRERLCRIRLLHEVHSGAGDSGDYLLLVTMHHSLSDEWSVGIFMRELVTLYQAYTQGQRSPLEPLPIQYADFAQWQRRWLQGAVLEEQLSYWRKQLAELPPLLTLPTDRARPARQTFQGKVERFALPMSLLARLQALSREQGVTMFMTLLSAFAVLLGRYAGQQAVAVGTPIANRTRRETEGLIGFFVNTLVMRHDLHGDPRFVDLLKRTREVALQGYAHQDVPLEQIVEELNPQRSASHSPVFQVMFVLQNAPLEALELPGLTVQPLDWWAPEEDGAQEARFDLTLSARESPAGLAGALEYNTDLFDRTTIQRMLDHYARLLEAIVAAPQSQLSRLDIIGDAERRQLLLEWNATARAYPHEECIHELFEQQARQQPDSVALVHERAELTYDELNRQANRLAHCLRDGGVRPEERVGICMDRSPEMVIGVLAVLKAGAAYVPLDPTYPQQRLRYLVSDSAPALLLVDAVGRTALAELAPSVRVLDVVAEAPRWAQHSCENLRATDVGLTSMHAAYVIYTSGSTGTPKGVIVEHRGLCNLARAQIAEFGVEASGRVAQIASLSFDASASELAMALCGGATLYLPAGGRVLAGNRLLEVLGRAGITHVTLPPAVLSGLAPQDGLERLRTLIVAGEACSREVVETWAPGRRLLNAYGPTEATVCATAYRCDPKERGAPAIGRPISNARVYVLDRHLRAAPTGVVGEIYIGGAGIARGYSNRAALTAERFVPDALGGEPGARLYRTGDVGRWRSDGHMEFLGRADHQVKVRGFRIEPGEIESELRRHGAVRDAVVVVHEEAGDKRLVGYVVVDADVHAQGAPATLVEELRSRLHEHLPGYMVPSRFMLLSSLPLTANGKVDRKALPAPDGHAHTLREYEAPQGEIERVLAQLWQELLRVERVGRKDNFFELGGHSLLAVTLIERLRQQGLQTDVRALFNSPTLMRLAGELAREAVTVEVPSNRITADCERITPELLPLVALGQGDIDRIVDRVPGGVRNVQDIYPLAPLQEGILFHHLMSTGGDAYLSPVLMTFDTRERLDQFLKALQYVTGRHDILRTAVQWEGLSQPVQVVWRQARLAVEEVDLSSGDAAGELRERFDPGHCRLDIREAPLQKAFVGFDREHERWLLLLLCHHLALDHTALEVIFAEAQAYLLGEQDRLVSPMPFREFVAHARLGVSAAEHEEFFRGMLGDIEEPTAPFGWLDVRGDGAGITDAHLRVNEEVSKAIRRCARAAGVSAASLCHLAWAQVLSRLTNREEVVFGTVLFGRLHGEEGVTRGVGLFINTLPLRLSIGEQGVREALRSTHERLGQLLRHEHAPLALAQRCSAVLAEAPLFTTLLNYRYASASAGSELAQRGWEGIGMLSAEERTNYPLTLSVDDFGEGFGLTVQVREAVEPRRICELMHEALAQLAEALEKTAQRPMRSLASRFMDQTSLLSEAERHRQLVEWNATARSYPQEKCIHGLFEEQVAQAPDRIALVYEGVELTYSELNRRANVLAHRLIECGVGPEVRVGLCLPRSAEMLVGLLGILKSGGCYVPLDPGYPHKRLAYMLQDSGAALVVGDSSQWTFLDAAQRPRCLPVEAGAGSEGLPQTDPKVYPPSSALAYVIYTSGSTGAPKGVRISHANVVNFLRSMQEEPGLASADRVLAVTTLSFDIALLELCLPLTVGATVDIAPAASVMDGERLMARLEESRITALQGTPATWKLLLDSGWKGQQSLTALVGGEALGRELAARIVQKAARVWNLYGPTETTIWSTCCRVVEASRAVPIGRPIANTRVYVLDRHQRLVPVGVAGELYVGGAGVSQGYLNRPGLTAEKFSPDPYSQEPGERLCRTGDLARRLPGGMLEFLGRADHQVKVRGFRIELGEIENVLLGHEAVRDAVVVAREEHSGGNKLVGYVVAEASAPVDEAALVNELRSHLHEQLPPYMVPSAFMLLASLPLTANGKVDRKALPAPEGEAYAHQQYEAPQGEIERTLAQLWQELLRVERVGRYDNFFELGGHSLLAVTLIEQMRQQGLHSGVRALFSSPTLAQLAEQVELESCVAEVPENRIPADCERITPQMLPLVQLEQGEIERIVERVPGGARNVRDIYPLAPLQEGILFHHLMDTEGDAYLSPVLMTFDTRERLERFLSALQWVIGRHDILRTAVQWEGLTQPVQVVWRQARLVIEEVELSGADAARELRDRFDPRRYRLDIREAPLQKAFVGFDREQNRWLLLLLCHHLAFDHTALDMMFTEAQAYMAGEQDQLEMPVPFREFVAQARLGAGSAAHER